MTEQAQVRPPSQARGWVTMFNFWFGLALCQVLIFGLGLVLPGMMKDLGFGTAEAGTLGAVGYFITFLFLAPVNGYLTRFSPKRVLGFVFIGMTLVYVLSALAPNYTILLILRAVGIILAASTYAVIALIQNQYFVPRQMGTVNGIQTALVTVGQIIGLAVIPLLLSGFGGWRGTYNLTAIALAVITVLWFIFGKENRTPEYEARMAAQRQAGSPFWETLKRKEFLILGAGLGGAVIAYLAFLTFWPTFATDVMGLPLSSVGAVMSVIAFGSLIGSLLSGVISDRIGLRKPPIIVCTLLLPFAYFAMLKLDSVAALTVVAFLIGLLAFVYSPLLMTIPFELRGIKPQEIGIGISIIIALANLGMGLGAQLAGFLISSLGPYTGLLILCFSPLLMTLAILFIPETGPKAKKKEVLTPAPIV